MYPVVFGTQLVEWLESHRTEQKKKNLVGSHNQACKLGLLLPHGLS